MRLWALLLLMIGLGLLPWHVHAWVCTDAPVQCVGAGYHDSFGAAISACSVDNIGEVIPYDGESVIIEKHTVTPAVTVSADFWRISSGDGSIEITAYFGAYQNPLILVTALNVVEFSDVVVSVQNGVDSLTGIYHLTGSEIQTLVDGLLIESVRFLRYGHGTFDTHVSVFAGSSYTGLLPPQLRTYRVKIHRCTFSEVTRNSLNFCRLCDIEISRNYFHFDTIVGNTVAYIYQSARSLVVNNIFAQKPNSVLTPPSMIDFSYCENDHRILHNTFVVSTKRVRGFLTVSGSADVSGILVQNNLFGVPDGDTVAVVEADTGSYSNEFRCNRIDHDVLWQDPSLGYWNDSNANCLGGGVGAFAFRSEHDFPLPYYDLTGGTMLIAEDVTDIVPVDFDGRTRNPASPTIGAVRYDGRPPFCDEDHACAADGGYCFRDNECRCHDGHVGERCEFPLCQEIPASESGSVCNGRGVCVAVDMCDCDEGVPPFCADDNSNSTNSVDAMTGLSVPATIGIVLGSLLAMVVIFVLFAIVFMTVAVVVYRRKQSEYRASFRGSAQLEARFLDDIEDSEQNQAVAHLDIDNSLFEIAFSELKITRTIGRGGSNCVVFEGMWKGIRIAFKAFQLHALSDQARFDAFQQEARILGSIRHPNILGFYGACLAPPRVGIVMELSRIGDMKNYLSDNPTFPLPGRFELLRGIASAMEFLHSRSILHRDLKLRNVLIDDQLKAKVMDFGLSRRIQEDSITKTAAVGTSQYMAPEIILSGRYDSKVDVYSFGIMMFETLTGNFNPFGEGAHNVESRVANDPGYRPKFASAVEEASFPEIIVSAMRICWDDSPELRPTFADVLSVLNGVMGVDAHAREGQNCFSAANSMKLGELFGLSGGVIGRADDDSDSVTASDANDETETLIT